MPVTILPGESDPTGTLLPQQPLPRAMFGTVKGYDNFECVTNPMWMSAGSTSILAHAGQPLSDMFKYLPSPPATRIGIAASTLHWRHMAPTAPDTLWCYPYFTMDPFILSSTPDVYIVGNQPAFQTCLVEDGQADGEGEGEGKRRCRIVLVPSFAETGRLVLINTRSLDVRTVDFALEGMARGKAASEQVKQENALSQDQPEIKVEPEAAS